MNEYDYLAKAKKNMEKEKYHEMQQIAAEKAKARYRTLGV